MMVNLFSMFDPSTSVFNLNFLVLVFIFIVLLNSSWKMTGINSKMIKKLVSFLKKDIEFSVVFKEKGIEKMVFIIFFIIFINNESALFPSLFSVTSHLFFNFPLAILLWMSVIFFNLIKNFKNVLIHLVPEGTPLFLMFFMVFIEMLSIGIRPLTLSIRLTANMVAGHILLFLLSKFLLNSVSIVFFSTTFFSLVLNILEISVSLIQSYVFMTLVYLYTIELK